MPAEPKLVDVFVCTEAFAGASKPDEVFALYTARHETTPPSLVRWRKRAQTGVSDREVSYGQSAVIIDEPDIAMGLAGPLVVLLGRDVTHLVRSAAQYRAREELRLSALAKLSPAERDALGVSDGA